MSAYAEFIAQKTRRHMATGMDAEIDHHGLFPFQRYGTTWALKRGRACLFAGTGLGKTRMQIEFCRQLDGVRLIVAPLAVTGQTIREAVDVFGQEVRQIRNASDVEGAGIYAVNYDRIHLLEDTPIDAVVLDESSILKAHDGQYRQYLQDRFLHTPWKLACTATPAPNDYMELGTHAEFIGAMTRSEMLATFFTHDGGDTSKWRLKRHAVADFWQWVSTWALVFNHPSDIGFEQPGYDLPTLHVHKHEVEVEAEDLSTLFGYQKIAAVNLGKVARESIDDRVAVTAALATDAPWLIWCNLDDEQRALEKAIPDAVSVHGSDSPELKEDRLIGFAEGKYRALITKPRIAGYGMNWQRCANMAFCGVTYSFEQIYQSIRRCWRFGQQQEVHVHMVTANTQESIVDALALKEKAYQTMAGEMKKYTRGQAD